MIVRLGTLGLDVLLDGVNLRLVRGQDLLDIVESLVDVVLEDHISASVMLHSVIGGLLRQSHLVPADKLTDIQEFLLLSFMLCLQLAYLGELILHLIAHFVHILLI